MINLKWVFDDGKKQLWEKVWIVRYKLSKKNKATYHRQLDKLN